MLTAAIDSHVGAGLRARLVLHRESLRLRSGTIDPATCPADEALAVLVAEGDDWLPAAEVIVAYLEASVLARPEQAFERARRLTASGAPTPSFWRHRGLLLLGSFSLARVTRTPRSALTSTECTTPSKRARRTSWSRLADVPAIPRRRWTGRVLIRLSTPKGHRAPR